MKPSTSNNLPARRALFASAMVMLLGTATAIAQSSGAGGSTGTSGSSSASDTSRRNQSGGSTGSYDTGSTRDSSTPSSTSPSTGTRAGTSGTSGATGTTGSSQDAYGTSTPSSTRRSGAMTGSDKLSWGDRRFVSKAADEGQTEQQLAQLAAQRATNPEVRSYAQKLAREHSKVNQELMSLASQKGVKLDTDDDKDRAYKRLEKETGSEFDQEFVEHMIDAHERDIKMFEKAASDAKDPEVRSFASKHVSSLRDHLQEAQSLRQAVTPTGRTDSSSGRSTSGGTTGSGLGSTDSTSTGTTGTQRNGSTGTQRDSSTTGSSTGTSGTTGSSSSDTSPRRRD